MKLKKKKDGPHPQLNLLDDLEEIPRGEEKPSKRVIKTRKADSGTEKRKISQIVEKVKKVKLKSKREPIIKRDVRLSTTPPDKNDRKIIEREYEGFQVHVSDKEGRDANKTMATIEGKLGKYEFRVFLRLDGVNDTKGTAKAVKAIVDRIINKKTEAKDVKGDKAS